MGQEVAQVETSSGWVTRGEERKISKRRVKVARP